MDTPGSRPDQEPLFSFDQIDNMVRSTNGVHDLSHPNTALMGANIFIIMC